MRIRAFFAWSYCALASCLGFLVCLMRPFNANNNCINGWLFARGGRSCLGMRVDVEGREHLDFAGPRVVIANHQHNEDVFVLGDMLPPRTVVVGKSSLRWLPLFGQMLWLGGNVLINRRHRGKAIAAIQATRQALIEQRKSIWIFPEGTRNHGGELLPFKKGAFHAAIAAGVPISMVCVSRYQGSAGHGANGNPIRVKILPPVATDGMSSDDVPQLMSACYEHMRKAIAELNRYLPAPDAV